MKTLREGSAAAMGTAVMVASGEKSLFLLVHMGFPDVP